MRGIIVLVLCAACGSGGGVGGDDAGGGDDTPVPDGAGPFFTETMFWNRDVSAVTKSADSDKMIASLRAAGGWGNNDKMQIDFGFDVLGADSSTPMRTFTPTDEFYEPDCDHVPVPVPANGNLEGETGYSCTTDGDCHLIVHDKSAGKLYEMWRADINGTTFNGGCLAVWDTKMKYDPSLRGEQCTSADAAGFPIAPLLFTADEVAAGEIKHAIRFILPNNRIKKGYVRPATHGTNTTGGANAPPYGVHFRLRADYPVDALPSQGAKVVARALQRYGMYHADGGNIALTAQSDRYTTAKWDGLIRPQDLAALKVEDFDVIDEGAMITLTLDCARN
jgi:serine/threonine-protein kinase